MKSKELVDKLNSCETNEIKQEIFFYIWYLIKYRNEKLGKLLRNIKEFVKIYKGRGM